MLSSAWRRSRCWWEKPHVARRGAGVRLPATNLRTRYRRKTAVTRLYPHRIERAPFDQISSFVGGIHLPCIASREVARQTMPKNTILRSLLTTGFGLSAPVPSARSDERRSWLPHGQRHGQQESPSKNFNRFNVARRRYAPPTIGRRLKHGDQRGLFWRWQSRDAQRSAIGPASRKSAAPCATRFPLELAYLEQHGLARPTQNSALPTVSREAAAQRSWLDSRDQA